LNPGKIFPLNKGCGETRLKPHHVHSTKSEPAPVPVPPAPVSAS
jgi:hypothetical protein